MWAKYLLKSSLRKQLGDVPAQGVKSKVEDRHRAKEVYGGGGGVQLPGSSASLQSRKSNPVLGLRDVQTTLWAGFQEEAPSAFACAHSASAPVHEAQPFQQASASLGFNLKAVSRLFPEGKDRSGHKWPFWCLFSWGLLGLILFSFYTGGPKNNKNSKICVFRSREHHIFSQLSPLLKSFCCVLFEQEEGMENQTNSLATKIWLIKTGSQSFGASLACGSGSQKGTWTFSLTKKKGGGEMKQVCPRVTVSLDAQWKQSTLLQRRRCPEPAWGGLEPLDGDTWPHDLEQVWLPIFGG